MKGLEKMSKIWKKPKLLFRGMCPSMKKYPNELMMCFNKSYYEEKYKPYGWKVLPKKLIKRFL